MATDRLCQTSPSPSAHLPAELDLLSHQQTAVVLVDAEIRICHLNEAAESLFQVSLSRIAGEPLTTLIHLESAAALSEALDAFQPFTQREGQIEVLGSGPLTVDYSVTPIASPEPGYLLLEFQPLDRKLNIGREEERVNSQKTTRLLIRGLAHEVKNPLGGIRGSAQLLEAELTDDRLKEYTQVVIEEADRLRNLVDRLLGPNQPPNFAPMNIHRVLEHVVRLSSADAWDNPPTIVRDYDPSIPDIDGDDEQLVQALLNVIRNAHQALAEVSAAELRLRTQTLRRFTIGETMHRLVVRIDIEDNGPGIPADISDRLFFPMISGRPDGSGLGLAIAQTIISQHNGLIAVDSEPGCTRFAIYLPLQQRPEDCSARTHSSDPSTMQDQTSGVSRATS